MLCKNRKNFRVERISRKNFFLPQEKTLYPCPVFFGPKRANFFTSFPNFENRIRQAGKSVYDSNPLHKSCLKTTKGLDPKQFPESPIFQKNLGSSRLEVGVRVTLFHLKKLTFRCPRGQWVRVGGPYFAEMFHQLGLNFPQIRASNSFWFES